MPPTTIKGRRSANQQARMPLTDLSAYPVLTEEVGYSPSPLARTSSGAPTVGSGAPSLGQIVGKAVSEVLGWKVKQGDTKGFLGALNQSFTLTEVEGHTESKWTPRTYAVQTDLSGGITGAQASIYSRGKVALDQCLPLLDGLYKLDPEAVDEDVTALKAVVKSQLSELVNELGFLGGPRVTRVNQYFNLLLGTATFPVSPAPNYSLTLVDPDQIGGTLGNMRDELGLSFTHQDFVNSVEDETDLSNFRILSDYVTSLAQTWLNNVGFVVLNTTTPFFGTQLVLLSRQLSVIAESVDEVRFTLDSVFLGPAERQTMELRFPPASGLAPIFLEDWLSWAFGFATEEGPRLIQDGGKFGVQNTFYPVVNQLLTIAHLVPAVHGLPPGFYTPRVQLSVADLIDQLRSLASLAKPIEHAITPEPDFGLPLQVSGIEPNSLSINFPTQSPVTFRVRGSGFAFTSGAGGLPTVSFVNGPSWLPSVNASNVYFSSEGLLVAVVPLTLSAAAKQGESWSVQVTNPVSMGGSPAILGGGLTVMP
jgi:hypothetical protein